MWGHKEIQETRNFFDSHEQALTGLKGSHGSQEEAYVFAQMFERKIASR
jgi:hypothetical protein